MKKTRDPKRLVVSSLESPFRSRGSWSGAIDNAIKNPPDLDDFLFYSGGSAVERKMDAVQAHIGMFFGRTAYSWNQLYTTDEEPDHNSDDPRVRLKSLIMDRFLAEEREEKSENPTPGWVYTLQSKFFSWAMARRAALRGGAVHIAVWKDAPLVNENSFWGMFEVGILTGPDSKVDCILRHNLEPVVGGLVAIEGGHIA